MLFPFYWDERAWYTIDDADYGCNRVIIWTCDGSHRYATICELIQDCPSVRQLTKPCIIDALNDLTSLKNANTIDPSHWFLKVTQDGCLEIADPCICNDWDKYVIASDEDTNPGPLDTKVRWACSYDWLYCIDIEQAWPNLLVWRPSGPTGPFINPKIPDVDCDEVAVKLEKKWSEWSVKYECKPKEEPQYCECIYSWGTSATNPRDRAVRYFLTHQNCTVKPIDGWARDWSESYINGSRSVKGTSECFWNPTDKWVVQIKSPWLYVIRFSTYVETGWQSIYAIRCGLYENSQWEFREMWDFKYQAWENPVSWQFWEKWRLNRIFPNPFDEWVYTSWYRQYWITLELTWIPFANTYILNVVNTPVEIAMVVKPDMRWVDYRVNTSIDNDEKYKLMVRWDDGYAYGAGTSIRITRIDEAVKEDWLKEIFWEKKK